MNPICKFQLSAGNDTRQAFPVYKDDLTIDYALEQNQEFYRGKLSGKLMFQQDDFLFIRSKAFDTQFDIVISISYNGGQTWAVYWSGQFWKTDCQFNEDDQTAIVTPNVNDRYNAVLAGMDKEYNLIDLAPAMQPINLDKRPMIQIYVPGQSVVGCFLSGMWWEQECKVVDSESDLQNIYHFNLLKSVRVVDVTQQGSPGIPSVFYGDAWPIGNDQTEYTNEAYKFRHIYHGEAGGSQEYFQIIRVADSQIMWELEITNQAPTTYPTELTLSAVEGSGASGAVKLYLHDVAIYARYMTDVEFRAGLDIYDIPSDDIVENNRNYKYCTSYNYPNTILFSDRITSTPTKWGLYQPGQYYQPPYTYGETFPVARAEWGRLSIWFEFAVMNWVTEQNLRQSYTLKDAYPIWSVISVLLNQIAPGITHDGTTAYSTFLYGTNPITGVISQRLFITPKSNLISSGYDQPAQKAPITLKYITDMLRDCYRCFWYIDDNNRFRIEHISWFMNGGTYGGSAQIGMDLTALQVSRNGKPWAFGRNQYQFDKPDMPARYQFGWMDDVTELFEGFPIEIISKYVNQDNIEQIDVANFTSDVDYILLNPGEISKDGFVLLSPELSGRIYKLPYVNFRFNNADHILQNAWAAFAYLQRYYMYDMPARNVQINGVTQVVSGIKKLKTQNIKFPVLTEPNLTNLIKTELGNGTIQKMSVNLSSRNANTTLKYDTE